MAIGNLFQSIKQIEENKNVFYKDEICEKYRGSEGIIFVENKKKR